MASEACLTRLALFIDGNNLYHAAKQQGFKVDYGRLLAELTAGRELLRAIFYTGVDEQADRQRGFLHWMRRNGYKVVQKPVKLEKDGVRRARLEVEIATDMMAYADKIDLAILVSGDEDFAYPLEALAARGVRVEVAGLRTSMSAKVLDASDRFIELDPLIDRIRKDGGWDDDYRQRL